MDIIIKVLLPCELRTSENNRGTTEFRNFKAILNQLYILYYGWCYMKKGCTCFAQTVNLRSFYRLTHTINLNEGRATFPWDADIKLPLTRHHIPPNDNLPNRCHFIRYLRRVGDINKYDEMVEQCCVGKAEVHGEEPLTVPLTTNIDPRHSGKGSNWASAMTGLRPTA